MPLTFVEPRIRGADSMLSNECLLDKFEGMRGLLVSGQDENHWLELDEGVGLLFYHRLLDFF
jgi:hypothetical protein